MVIITGSVQKIQPGSAVIQYLAAGTCLINIFTSGMHYGWPSPSLPKLFVGAASFPVSAEEGSWIAVMPLLGAVGGSLMVGSTIDIIGRKRFILMSSIPFFAAWLMVAFANSVAMIYMARIIAGVADGWIFTAVPMYIGEIADPKIRGMLGSGVSVVWIFGILIINVIGSYLTITDTAIISSCLPIITVITFVFMPESPYYLIKRDKPDEARKSMQKFRGLTDVDMEFNRVSFAVKSKTKEGYGKFWDLFTKKVNRRAVYIMLILRGTQQMSGTTAVTFYTQTIFLDAGDFISADFASIIYFFVQLICGCLCGAIVDKAGRRPLLITSILGSTIFLFIEGAFFYIKSCTTIDISSFSLVPMIGLVGFVITFSLGMQTIPILMLGELFSPSVKAFALCFADIYFAVIATAVSKFFQIMKDSFGLYTPFFSFSLSCLVGMILIILFVPETKGKTLEDIQAHLEGGKKSRNEVEAQNVI